MPPYQIKILLNDSRTINKLTSNRYLIEIIPQYHLTIGHFLSHVCNICDIGFDPKKNEINLQHEGFIIPSKSSISMLQKIDTAIYQVQVKNKKPAKSIIPQNQFQQDNQSIRKNVRKRQSSPSTPQWNEKKTKSNTLLKKIETKDKLHQQQQYRQGKKINKKIKRKQISSSSSQQQSSQLQSLNPKKKRKLNQPIFSDTTQKLITKSKVMLQSLNKQQLKKTAFTNQRSARNNNNSVKIDQNKCQQLIKSRQISSDQQINHSSAKNAKSIKQFNVAQLQVHNTLTKQIVGEYQQKTIQNPTNQVKRMTYRQELRQQKQIKQSQNKQSFQNVIRGQINYYFSNKNYQKDLLMQAQANLDPEKYIQLQFIQSFPKIKQNNLSLEQFSNILSTDPYLRSRTYQLSINKLQIRKKGAIKFHQMHNLSNRDHNKSKQQDNWLEKELIEAQQQLINKQKQKKERVLPFGTKTISQLARQLFQ